MQNPNIEQEKSDYAEGWGIDPVKAAAAPASPDADMQAGWDTERPEMEDVTRANGLDIETAVALEGGTKLAAGPGGKLDGVMGPGEHAEYEKATGESMRIPAKKAVAVEAKPAPISNSDTGYKSRNDLKTWDESYAKFKKLRPDMKDADIIKAMNLGPRPKANIVESVMGSRG